MTALDSIIRNEIRAQGAMRFDRYMELALYHSAHGYYSGGHARIGRTGDYFTSVSVGPLFGQLLARQARQMWALLGEPAAFWIVEQGAHDGQLAIDILQGCQVLDPAFAAAVRYGIVEPNLSTRETQEQRCTEAKLAMSVAWFENRAAWREEKATALFLSNELVDAFPVRLVRYHAGVWNERHVGLEDDALCWEDFPVKDQLVRSAIEESAIPAVEGYTTEIHLAATTWMSEVAEAIERGYVLTIDYGFPASVYYAPFRTGGTLTSYRDHRRDGDVLSDPGEHDITAHVDFTALARAGDAGSLATLALVDQQRFLMGVAHGELSGEKEYSDRIQKQLRAWNTLTHPDYLGSRFQVLVQAKNAPRELDGLRYASAGGLH